VAEEEEEVTMTGRVIDLHRKVWTFITAKFICVLKTLLHK
jgi:hypothetical protein